MADRKAGTRCATAALVAATAAALAIGCGEKEEPDLSTVETVPTTTTAPTTPAAPAQTTTEPAP